MSDLLPCPFCGGRGVLNLSAPLPYIYCESCDAHGTECDTKKGAVEHWNARAALDRIRQEAREEALREAINSIRCANGGWRSVQAVERLKDRSTLITKEPRND